mmetsp:Transcript_32440/g.50520  ORF Transcript_32440/g.50520 Transcript_32440/m.50520 type:complete len:95 (-) Transcript_32440:2479-2763(-)
MGQGPASKARAGEGAYNPENNIPMVARREENGDLNKLVFEQGAKRGQGCLRALISLTSLRTRSLNSPGARRIGTSVSPACCTRLSIPPRTSLMA